MKISNNRMFPYPVLSSMNDDYKNAFFVIKVSAERSRKKLKLIIIPNLKSRFLEKLIHEDLAKIVVHFECSRTKFRHLDDLISGNNNFEFASGELNENLQIIAFIIAKKDIPTFGGTNSEWNDDYGTSFFRIEKGSILAISNQLDVPIQKDIYDFSNVNSIVSVVPNSEEKERMKIDLSSSKIRVLLPEKAYNAYSSIGKAENIYTPIIHAMFVIPSLVYALDYLKNLDEWIDVENNLWFQVVKKKCEEMYGEFDSKTIENKTSVIIAQELINNPILEAIQTLLKMEVKS